MLHIRQYYENVSLYVCLSLFSLFSLSNLSTKILHQKNVLLLGSKFKICSIPFELIFDTRKCVRLVFSVDPNNGHSNSKNIWIAEHVIAGFCPFSCPLFRPPFKYWTILCPLFKPPFELQTILCQLFRCHLINVLLYVAVS